MDGVGPLAGLHLVHVLVVLEEGVPVVARGERGLGLGSADLLIANEIYIHINFKGRGNLLYPDQMWNEFHVKGQWTKCAIFYDDQSPDFGASDVVLIWCI